MSMENNWNENRAVLYGTVAASPVLSHENHGVLYDTFPLVIQRLSGTEDQINVVTARPLLEAFHVSTGTPLGLSGEVRSFNNKSGKGSRLVITVFAKELLPSEGVQSNDLHLAGVLCKPPIFRRTPLGRQICDLMLAVNRKYGRADYLPCISWGGMAQRCGALQVGNGIHIDGRIQSRGYTKLENGLSSSRTAYEISIMKLRLTGEPEEE